MCARSLFSISIKKLNWINHIGFFPASVSCLYFNNHNSLVWMCVCLVQLSELCLYNLICLIQVCISLNQMRWMHACVRASAHVRNRIRVSKCIVAQSQIALDRIGKWVSFSNKFRQRHSHTTTGTHSMHICNGRNSSAFFYKSRTVICEERAHGHAIRHCQLKSGSKQYIRGCFAVKSSETALSMCSFEFVFVFFSHVSEYECRVSCEQESILTQTQRQRQQERDIRK